ncbi:hypothetical protein [Priestia megaterium]|uniref:hypothetical protein n=1 Tax=Priestia megaterium TaxID=1404 RepID=UPI003A7FD666
MDLQETLTTIATSGVVTGFLVFGARTWFKAGLDSHYKKKLQAITHDYDKKIRDLNHHYDEKLAKFNEQITIQSDHRKADFDRKIHDFTLYSTKRHEVYPELFKQMYKIHYELTNLETKSFFPKSIVNSKDKLILCLKEMGVTFNERFILQIDEVYAKHQNSGTFYVVLQVLLKEHFNSEIARLFNDLENFYRGNLLYLSDKVADEADRLIYGMGYLIAPTIAPHLMGKVDENLLRQEIDDRFIGFKEILKKELTVGDYSNLNNNP